jgi:putative membrane protein
MSATTTSGELEPKVQRGIYALSAVLCLVVAGLVLGPVPPSMRGAVDVSALPFVNASLNSVTALLLLLGFAAVRTGHIDWHRRLMTSAFGTSTLFLLSYVTYHWFSEGPAVYEGAFRGLYLFVLFTHIVLAAAILPLALTAGLRGWLGAIDAHRRIAPATLAVWLYVSVTGVAIVWMAHT